MCNAIMRAFGWSSADAIATIKAARPVAQVCYSTDADAAVHALGYV